MRSVKPVPTPPTMPDGLADRVGGALVQLLRAGCSVAQVEEAKTFGRTTGG